MKEYHVLNLGAGVQSTTLYLLDERLGHGGDLRFDVAIFADTQAEPKSVYRHLAWLRSLDGPVIDLTTAGNLEADLLAGLNATGQSVDVTIPCFLGFEGSKEALSSRQCTHQYKIDPILKAIRSFFGLRRRQRFPKDIKVFQHFGITTDEVRRMGAIRKRFESIRWAEPRFPLIDRGWSRRGCAEWLRSRVPHTVPKSACVFCPFRDDRGWAEMKRDEPEEFARAVVVDKALRREGMTMIRGQQRWLHRSCIPLEMVDFDNLPPQTLEPFTLYDCVGMCGV